MLQAYVMLLPLHTLSKRKLGAGKSMVNSRAQMPAIQSRLAGRVLAPPGLSRSEHHGSITFLLLTLSESSCCPLTTNELQDLIYQNYGEGKHQHEHPIVSIQWAHCEDFGQERNVEDHEVGQHGSNACEDQPRIVPRRHLNQGSVLRKSIECVHHFDHDKNGQRER